MGDLVGGEADGPAGALPRNPWNIVLAVLCAVALVAALSFCLWSRSVSSEASTARDQAAAADAERRDLANQQLDANRGRAHLNGAAGGASIAFEAYVNALEDVTDAQRQLVDVQNRAIELANRGNQAAADALLRSDGDPLLTEVTEKVAVLDQSLAALQAKDADLQAAADG